MIQSYLEVADGETLILIFRNFFSQLSSFWNLLNNFQIVIFPLGTIYFGRLLVAIVVVTFAMSVISKR